MLSGSLSPKKAKELKKLDSNLMLSDEFSDSQIEEDYGGILRIKRKHYSEAIRKNSFKQSLLCSHRCKIRKQSLLRRPSELQKLITRRFSREPKQESETRMRKLKTKMKMSMTTHNGVSDAMLRIGNIMNRKRDRGSDSVDLDPENNKQGDYESVSEFESDYADELELPPKPIETIYDLINRQLTKEFTDIKLPATKDKQRDMSRRRKKSFK